MVEVGEWVGLGVAVAVGAWAERRLVGGGGNGGGGGEEGCELGGGGAGEERGVGRVASSIVRRGAWALGGLAVLRGVDDFAGTGDSGHP